MLKMLEGTEVNVPPQGGRKHPEQKLVKVNTNNILFEFYHFVACYIIKYKTTLKLFIHNLAAKTLVVYCFAAII